MDDISKDKDPSVIVDDNWQRYQYGLNRGHREYTYSAKVLEGFYIGGDYDAAGKLMPGGQWNDADLAILDSEGRPAYEINQIKPGLEAAFGYQISNRLDIAFQPRSGDANKITAEIRSKVAKQISDNNKVHWVETDVFADGMIQRRGYYNVRMDFDDSLQGELRVTHEDPMDVIPDPDASSYDPKYWQDVIVTRVLSLDGIEGHYGVEARKKAEESVGAMYPGSWVEETGDREKRNTFGSSDTTNETYLARGEGETVYRIIDRQKHIRTMMQVSVTKTGDVRPLNGDETPEQLQQLMDAGNMVIDRAVNRVRWTVTTRDALLFDKWSPYDRFTIVPFFPYFRRGQTRGMVDAAIGPQKILNKSISQTIHILNTTANSGYQVEEGQLTEISMSDLKTKGSSNGLVLERIKGSPLIEKIHANPMPQGVDRLITLGSNAIQEVTVPDAMRGIVDGSESGIAVQSRQHAAQQILSVPLDNLSRTRHMLAEWYNYGISKYYDTERVFRITKIDPSTGKEIDDILVINQFDPSTGSYINDMTAGEYDVVVSDQPIAVTFENSQYQQCIEMREKGIQIPDPVVIKHSSLTDKHDVITMLQEASVTQPDPLTDAKVKLIESQTRKTDAEAVNKNVEGMFSATQAGQQIAGMPQIAPIADEIYLSAGGKDQNTPPMFEQPQERIDVPPIPENTNPLTPTNPSVGMDAGIEGGKNTQGEMLHG